jgi:chromosome segregation ATPase
MAPVTDDTPVSIPDVLAWIRRQPPSDWMTRAAGALEAAQELEAERDECGENHVHGDSWDAMRERAERAEAERDNLNSAYDTLTDVLVEARRKLTERAEKAEQRVRELEAERDEWRRHAGMLDKKLNKCLDEGFRTAQDAEKAEAEAARYRASADGLATEVATEVVFIRNLGASDTPIEAGWPELTAALDRLHALAVAEREPVQHNHLTRDIRPKGTCPKCDALHWAKREPSEAEPFVPTVDVQWSGEERYRLLNETESAEREPSDDKPEGSK